MIYDKSETYILYEWINKLYFVVSTVSSMNMEKLFMFHKPLFVYFNIT